MSEPSSWLVVERGWKVVGGDSEDLGRVEDTVGDSTRDIFSGLAVSHGLLGKPLFVPAELVTEIVDGEVHLSIGKAEFERLDEHDEPPTTAQIRPE